MMRRGTSLHPDEARRQSLEEPEDLRSSKLLPEHDAPAGIDAVDLEHVLGEIEPNRHAAHCKSSLRKWTAATPYQALTRGAGAVHPIKRARVLVRSATESTKTRSPSGGSGPRWPTSARGRRIRVRRCCHPRMRRLSSPFAVIRSYRSTTASTRSRPLSRT